MLDRRQRRDALGMQTDEVTRHVGHVSDPGEMYVLLARREEGEPLAEFTDGIAATCSSRCPFQSKRDPDRPALSPAGKRRADSASRVSRSLYCCHESSKQTTWGLAGHAGAGSSPADHGRARLSSHRSGVRRCTDAGRNDRALRRNGHRKQHRYYGALCGALSIRLGRCQHHGPGPACTCTAPCSSGRRRSSHSSCRRVARLAGSGARHGTACLRLQQSIKDLTP